MKRKKTLRKILCGILLTSSLTAVCVTDVAAAGVISQTKSATATQKSATWPSGPKKSRLSCDSAIVMELSTGSILYKKNIHKQHYPASITKIMTAMLTAENCSMSETVTFSESAVYGIEAGSSTIYSEVGEKLTVEQCLYAIMLESANEVCLGVGEHISGSISKFVDKMNERVKELGLKDTHFNNPNGLPDPKHYTTAYDMAVIAREAMKNSTFRKVAATRNYVMPKTNKHKQVRYWNNHHQMINGYKYPKYEYKYCIGGKTGYTHVARNTLVTFAEKDGMELVCVIMYANGPTQGEPNEYTDTTTLLNYGFEKYKKYTVDEKTSDINKDLFNNYDSYFDTEESPIHLAGESSVVLPKGVELSQATQKISYDQNVTLQEGENVIGHVTYTYGGRTVGSTDILYTKAKDTAGKHLDAASRKIVDTEIKQIEETEKKDEEKANFWRKIKNAIVSVFRIKAVQIILLLLVAVAVFFGIFCMVKNVRLPKLQLGRKQRKRMVGGYRSKRGKRKYNRRMRRERSEQRKANKRVRRNHSSHYEKQTQKAEKKKRSKGVRYNRRHKKTKESFGKNFFDF
ncbi:MAG: D-alanyl-D-alanine carboxypeptidase family protein [Butyribacter sp.]|nr:D-alanyl-D-alanine carboxypeptidase [bacterium]MDY3854203.1 D-alanyl-D-alanine carboxypeptidase family protein [Butyribacter sp.]